MCSSSYRCFLLTPWKWQTESFSYVLSNFSNFFAVSTFFPPSIIIRYPGPPPYQVHVKNISNICCETACLPYSLLINKKNDNIPLIKKGLLRLSLSCLVKAKLSCLKTGRQLLLTFLMDALWAVMLLTALIKRWRWGGWLRCLQLPVLKSPLLAVFNRITEIAQHLWHIKQHKATFFLWQVMLHSSYILHVSVIAESVPLCWGVADPSPKIHTSLVMLLVDNIWPRGQRVKGQMLEKVQWRAVWSHVLIFVWFD